MKKANSNAYAWLVGGTAPVVIALIAVAFLASLPQGGSPATSSQRGPPAAAPDWKVDVAAGGERRAQAIRRVGTAGGPPAGEAVPVLLEVWHGKPFLLEAWAVEAYQG